MTRKKTRAAQQRQVTLKLCPQLPETLKESQQFPVAKRGYSKLGESESSLSVIDAPTTLAEWWATLGITASCIEAAYARVGMIASQRLPFARSRRALKRVTLRLEGNVGR